jgi:hypothetical protein
MVFKEGHRRQKMFFDYIALGAFWDHVEDTTQFKYPHYHTHERITKDASAEHKDYLRSKKWVVDSAFDRKLSPYCILGIYNDLIYFWATSADTKEYTQVVKKHKDSKKFNIT